MEEKPPRNYTNSGVKMEIKEERHGIKEEEIEEKISPMEVTDSKQDIFLNIHVKREEETLSETEESLKNRQVKMDTGETSHSCLRCRETFISEVELNAHMKVHTRQKPFMCSECGLSCECKSDFERHARFHTKPFECAEYLKTYTHKSDFKRHVMTHFREKTYACSLCEKSFILKGNYVAHLRVHTGEKPFKCSKCGKSFRHKRLITNHKCVHSGLNEFTCNQCERKFDVASSLRAHVLEVHLDGKRYLCSVCGERFASAHSLKDHQSAHMEQKPFECSRCGNRFASQTSLQRHMLVYSEKNIKCFLCGVFFKSKEGLLKHQEVHRQVKHPYNCDQCGQGFKYRSCLREHQHIHTRFISFSCDQCNAQFTETSQSGESLEDHAAGKPRCSSCGTNFSSIKSLKINKVFTKERKVICSLSVDKVLQIPTASPKKNQANAESSGV